jgi:myb proto-oncogene protein
MNVVHINIKYKYQEAMQGENLRKGTWLQEEDEQLTCFVTRLGERRWDSLAKVAGMFYLDNYGDNFEILLLNILNYDCSHSYD